MECFSQFSPEFLCLSQCRAKYKADEFTLLWEADKVGLMVYLLQTDHANKQEFNAEHWSNFLQNTVLIKFIKNNASR